MAKKIEYWDCEICSARYLHEGTALECEQGGRAETYPVGTIFADNTPGAFYDKIVFAVADNCLRGHVNDMSLWACRDMPVGDSLGNQMCGGGHSKLHESDKNINRDMPAFKRMVEWLKSQNIPIYIWNGKRSVPYKE